MYYSVRVFRNKVLTTPLRNVTRREAHAFALAAWKAGRTRGSAQLQRFNQDGHHYYCVAIS